MHGYNDLIVLYRVRLNYLGFYTMSTMINPFMVSLDLIMLTQQNCLLTFLDIIYLLCRYKKSIKAIKIIFFSRFLIQ